jgi:hypothetical protein
VLGILISEVHQLWENYFQNTHENLIVERLTDQEAEEKDMQDGGHNRIDVALNYIP